MDVLVFTIGCDAFHHCVIPFPLCFVAPYCLNQNFCLTVRIASSNCPVGRFCEIIILLSTTIVRHHTGASNNGPDRTSSKADAKLDFIFTLTIASELSRVLTCWTQYYVKTYCVWPHSAAWESLSEWWCVNVRKIASKEGDRQET